MKGQSPNEALVDESSLGCNFPATRSSRVLRLWSILLLVSGCAPLSLKPTVDHLPNISKIPLEVGIYYSPEFRAYEYSINTWNCRPNPPGVYPLYPQAFPLGHASVTLLDQLFPLMFRSITHVQSRPPLPPSGRELSVIIEPDIENFRCSGIQNNSRLRSGILPGRQYTSEITYHLTLYSPAGEPLAHLTVSGLGDQEWTENFAASERSSMIAMSADLAMQDAASKIAIQFRDIPAVKRLLEEKR